jgi:hypothetical protein
MIDRTLRWKAPPGQPPSVHIIYLIGLNGELWSFTVDGGRTKVPVPRLPVEEFQGALDDATFILGDEVMEALGIEGILPLEIGAGGYGWQHDTMYVPGFEFNNYSYVDLGSRARRAWTRQFHLFTYGGD